MSASRKPGQGRLAFQRSERAAPLNDDGAGNRQSGAGAGEIERSVVPVMTRSIFWEHFHPGERYGRNIQASD
jgi:hypothetical protein